MKEIINRKEVSTMYSNLVYPDWTNTSEYRVLGRLDEQFVAEELERIFEATDIANKYAILMPNGSIWYKHDFHVYVLLPISENLVFPDGLKFKTEWETRKAKFEKFRIELGELFKKYNIGLAKEIFSDEEILSITIDGVVVQHSEIESLPFINRIEI